MKTFLQLLFLTSASCLFIGCASPRFQSVSIAPPGHAIVYIYSLTDVSAGNGMGGGLNRISRNDIEIGKVGPRQCIADFPKPGKVTYTVATSWVSGGGLIGHMFLDKPEAPTPAVLSVDAGRTYYLRVLGARPPSFMRVDDDSGVDQLQPCRLVRTGKPE